MSDVLGNTGTVPPAHIVSVLPKLNTGTILAVTVTVNVTTTGVTHCPAVGVNVYVPEFWLSTTAGLHVPVMPFVDVVGSVGTFPPAQMVMPGRKLKSGVRFGFTVTVNVVVVAHSPDVGVNVYTPEFWLSTTDGLQVPVIPFVEVVGNDGTVPPAQIVRLVPKLNVGVIFGFTVTVNVVPVAH